jgi:hypothetical protein
MTVSMADIPVLHSAEVAHLYAQVVLPICHGVMNPIQLYQRSEERSIGIPRLKSHHSELNLRTSLYQLLPYCPCPFRVR